MAKPSAAPGWQLTLLILTGTVVGVVVVSCLYWAQTVFIPVALAVFLSFLLAPLVTGGVETNREQLQDAGADLIATTLLETRNQLNSLLPILTQQQGKPVAG